MPNDLKLLNPEEWEKQKIQYIKKMRKKGDTRKDIEIIDEMEEQNEKKEQYNLDRSAGSCKLKDI